MTINVLHITNIQETFDTIYKHLLDQGGKSVDRDTGICMYRGPNGTKCAIGCLIPDDKYDPKWERLPIGDLTGVITFDNAHTYDMCKQCQSAHDRYNKGLDGDWTNYIKVSLLEIATQCKLIIPVNIESVNIESVIA